MRSVPPLKGQRVPAGASASRSHSSPPSHHPDAGGRALSSYPLSGSREAGAGLLGGVAAWEMFAACQSERKLHGDSGLGSLAAGYFLGRLPGWGAQGLETRLWPGSPGF